MRRFDGEKFLTHSWDAISSPHKLSVHALRLHSNEQNHHQASFKMGCLKIELRENSEGVLQDARDKRLKKKTLFSILTIITQNVYTSTQKFTLNYFYSLAYATRKMKNVAIFRTHKTNHIFSLLALIWLTMRWVNVINSHWVCCFKDTIL